MLFISDLEILEVLEENLQENQMISGGTSGGTITPVFLGATSGTGLSANFAPTKATTQVVATSTSNLVGLDGVIQVDFGTQIQFISQPS